MTAGRHVNTKSQSWCTPGRFVDAIKSFWGGNIDLDPCSNRYSIVNALTEYCLPEHDGLAESWNYNTIYVNPPYGADRARGTTIKHWLARCAAARKDHGSQVIALIPVAPNTKHWKEYVFGEADVVCFLYDTRLRFLVDGEDTGKGAPMACCLVYWGSDSNRFINHFASFGAPVNIQALKTRNIIHPNI